MNARQHNRALSTRDTDNPMLIGDELTGSHKRGDMTALGAGQVKVPNAHRSVAATNNGEQVCAQGAHGAHCRPAAEWVQPGRRHSVDNWSIRQPVASRTHRSVTDVVTQNCHPCPETQHPVAEDGVQIGHKGAQPRFTQRYEPRNHAVLSDALSTRCRLCIRFGHSPPLQGSARLEPQGRPFAGITVTRAHPDPDGTPHPATPSFSWTVTVLSGWPDIDRPGGWIVWTIMLRQPGSMSTDTSPFHRSRPPSQQVRPASPTQPRGPGRTCPPGSWRRHRCPACAGSSEASRCGRICPPCRVAEPGSAGRRWH